MLSTVRRRLIAGVDSRRPAGILGVQRLLVGCMMRRQPAREIKPSVSHNFEIQEVTEEDPEDMGLKRSIVPIHTGPVHSSGQSTDRSHGLPASARVMRSRAQSDKRNIDPSERQKHRMELDSTPRLVLCGEQGQQGNHPCAGGPISADPDDRHDTHRMRGGRAIFGTT